MMTEEEYYRINRDKIDLNDISTWKYFPVGEAMRKTYDYYNLNLNDYLDRYYKKFDKEFLWEEWMKDTILPVYNNEMSKWKRFNFNGNKTKEYELWFEEKHRRMNNSFAINKSLKFFEKDIILFFSYLDSFDFFQDLSLTLESWINTKNFNVGGRHKVAPDIYSLQDMAKEEYGNNLVRDKLMSLEWHKR